MGIFEKAKDAVDTSARQKEVEELALCKKNFSGQIAAIDAEIAKKNTEFKDAAFNATTSDDRKAYDTVWRKIENLKSDRLFQAHALTAVEKKLAAAHEALHAARSADRERKAIEYNKRRDKHTAKAVEHLAGLYREHSKFIELGREIANEFPELTMKHVGTLVPPDEWLRALEVEIARVSSPGILPPPMAIPALPGSRAYALGGNPTNATQLTEIVANAGAELLRRVTKAEEKPHDFA